MLRYARYIFCALLFAESIYAQIGQGSESYLARAGDVFISEREFLERFELTPGLYRHRKPQLEGEKTYFLYSLIAEKLLAQEALARKLDRDSMFQQALVELTKLMARDELYKVEVSQKVVVSPKEIQRGMAQAVKERKVSFFFFPNEADAQFIRKQIKKPGDFDRLRIDSTMDVVRDTATVLWGDADTLIETAAYRLQIGEISPLIRTGDGYYLLRLSSVQPSPTFSKLGPEVLRERVTSRIRSRKERVRMTEYIATTLKGKVGYSPPGVFKRFADDVMGVFSVKSSPPRTTMTREMAEELITACKADLNDTLIVAGDRVWTVRQTIQRLFVKSFTIAPNALRRIPRRLFDSFEEWAQQELLAQEAFRRGLDRLPEVQQQLDPWRDQYLAFMMKKYSNDHVSVPDGEVYGYMKTKDASFVTPQVEVQELRTRTLDEMREALTELDNGVPLGTVIQKWSIDPEARARKGDTGFFPISERSPIGEIAWQLEVGERYGPIRDTSSIVFFEVLAKRDTAVGTDTAFARRFVEAKGELLQMKQKRMLTLFLSQTAAKRGFEIYEDRLRSVKATAIPMLAYRFLGFGGRMFAVPMVDRQLQWLEVEPPKTTILP